MKTSILGASGFIGQHLLKKITQSHAVSLRDESWRDQLVESEILVNLVGKAHDHQGTATEADYWNANVKLTQEIYHAFVASNAKLLIHVSSLAALEEFDSDVPLTEKDPCRPVSWYGKSKREAEKWLLDQQLPIGKKVLIIRPPMVHGEGDKGNLGLLYKLISKGIPYPLSSFDNSRSFISIENFCFFIEKMIVGSEEMKTGIYHVADDEALSTKEIIHIIQRVTGRKTINLALPKALVQFVARLGDSIPIPINTKRLKKLTGSLVLSNAKIKSALAITNLPYSAAEGLEKTIRSFNVNNIHQ